MHNLWYIYDTGDVYMIIYDFDKTIYKKDSGIEIFFYALKYNFFIMFIHFFKMFYWLILYIFNKITYKELKEKSYSFLSKINNLDRFINLYANHCMKGIKSWYKKTKNDIIISASLNIWIYPICKKLGVKNVICTMYDIKTSKIKGNEVKGIEKLNLYKKKYKIIPLESYADNKSDMYILAYAKKGYVVSNNNIYDYNEYVFKNRIIDQFLNKNFILFIICGLCGTLTNFVFSLIISKYLNPLISYVIGYSISLFVSYFLNEKLIYKGKLKIIKFIKFIVSYIPNFIILFSCVYLFINILSWHKVFAYLLSALIGIPLTYIITKIFAFSKKEI